MITVQAPQGASVEYTSQAMRQVEAVCAKEKDIIGAFTVVGFSFSGSGANKGMVFLNLANVDKRKGAQNSATAIVNRIRGPLMQLTDVQAFPFLPPAIAGISSFGGFTFEVQDEGGNSSNSSLTLPRTWCGKGIRAKISAACSVPSPPMIRSSW